MNSFKKVFEKYSCLKFIWSPDDHDGYYNLIELALYEDKAIWIGDFEQVGLNKATLTINKDIYPIIIIAG